MSPRQVAMRWAPLQRGQQLGKCSYDAWGSGPTPTIDLQACRPCMGSGSSPSPTICLQARRPCMGMCWSAAEQYLTSLVQSCLLALQCVLCQRQSSLWQSGEQYLTARQAQHLHDHYICVHKQAKALGGDFDCEPWYYTYKYTCKYIYIYTLH